MKHNLKNILEDMKKLEDMSNNLLRIKVEKKAFKRKNLNYMMK